MVARAFPLQSNNSKAIGYMLLSMLFFAGGINAVGLLADQVGSPQIVLFRNIFGLAIIIAWLLCTTKRLPNLRTTRLKSHFLRACIGFFAMETWFYSLTVMPVTLATSLSFTTPIFATIIAIIFLKEKAGLRRWGAIMIGFIGTVIILQPGFGDADYHMLFALVAAFLVAITITFVKSLTRTESPDIIVLYMALFILPLSVLPALATWGALTTQHYIILFMVALGTTGGQLFTARAFARADMVMLLPFDFTRLIFTAIFAYFLFGETMSLNTVLGASIIVASSVYIAHREAKMHKIHRKTGEKP